MVPSLELGKNVQNKGLKLLTLFGFKYFKPSDHSLLRFSGSGGDTSSAETVNPEATSTKSNSCAATKIDADKLVSTSENFLSSSLTTRKNEQKGVQGNLTEREGTIQ
jgi:hypothetical protein